MGTRTQNLGKEGYLIDVIGTLTGAGVSRSPVRGNGAAFSFSASIIGKTLKVQDAGATTTTMRTITFTRTNLGIPSGNASSVSPTLAQVVAALNSVFGTDAAKTVASAGADGRLVITGLGDLTIGDGSANIEFGWSGDGLLVKHGTGLTITFPTTFLGVGFTEYLYGMVPRSIAGYTYTPADGSQAIVAAASQIVGTWTPATRTLVLTGGAAGQTHIILEY